MYIVDAESNTINISDGQNSGIEEGAISQGNTMNQTINNTGEPLDLVALATELATLRIEIAKLLDSSPQAMIAAGEIAKAEIAAAEKDATKVMQHLKEAGKWALDTATKIGTSAAAEIIKKSMGMP
jgi:hypothetical protein